jgi:hypothetical protein
MKNINIGITNLVVSNKLKDSYFNNNLIEESKKLTADFFDIIKSSPILQLEFKVFDSLENKTIENELTATRYIDNNIKLFEVYTISEIDAEREKLIKFLNDDVVTKLTEGIYDYDLEKIELYNAIDVLITESLNDYDKVNVDDIHNAFETVLKHIKTPKVLTLTEGVENNYIGDGVIEIAITKFNEKYESLNEIDKTLLKCLIKSNGKEKQELLEEYKKECLGILEGVNKDTIEEKILKTIQKIREMKYNKNTTDDDIIGLHELKRGLL